MSEIDTFMIDGIYPDALIEDHHKFAMLAIDVKIS